jgi:hypothetical protein
MYMTAMGNFHRLHAKAPQGAFVFVSAFAVERLMPALGAMGRMVFA